VGVRLREARLVARAEGVVNCSQKAEVSEARFVFLTRNRPAMLACAVTSKHCIDQIAEPDVLVVDSLNPAPQARQSPSRGRYRVLFTGRESAEVDEWALGRGTEAEWWQTFCDCEM
jgi:hypothetical protein